MKKSPIAHSLLRSVSRIAFFSFFFVGGGLVCSQLSFGGTFEAIFAQQAKCKYGLQQSSQAGLQEEHLARAALLSGRKTIEDEYTRAATLAARAGTLERHVRDAGQKEQELVQKLETSEKAIRELERGLKGAQKRANDLQVQVILVATNRDVFEKKAKEYSNKLNSAEQALLALQRNYSTEQQKSKEETQAVEKLKEEHQRLSGQKEEANEKLKAAERALDNLQKEKLVLETNVKDGDVRLKAEIKNKDALSQRLADVTREKTNFEAQLKEAQKHISALKAPLADLMRQLQDARNEEFTLRNDMLELYFSHLTPEQRRKAGDLKSVLAGVRLNDLFARLTDQFSSTQSVLEAEKANLEAELNTLRASTTQILDDQRRKMEKKSQDFAHLEAEKEKTIQRLREKIEHLEANILRVEEERNDLVRRLEQKEHALAVVIEEKDRLQQEVHELRNQLAEKHGQEGALMAQIEALKLREKEIMAAQAATQSLLATAQEVARGEAVDHEKRLQALRTEMDLLVRRTEEDKQALETYHRESMNALGVRYKEALDVLERNVLEKQSALDAAENKIKEMSSSDQEEQARLSTVLAQAQADLKKAKTEAEQRSDKEREEYQQRLQRQKEAYEIQLEGVGQDLVETQGELERAQAALIKLREEALGNARIASDHLNLLREQITEQNRQLTATKADLEARHQGALLRQAEEHQISLHAKKSALDQQRVLLKEAQDKLQLNQEELDVALRERAELLEKNRITLESMSGVKRDLEELGQVVSRLTNQKEILENRNNELSASLEKESSAHQQVRDQLHLVSEELNERVGDLEAAKGRLLTLEKDRSENTQRLIEAQEQVAELSEMNRFLSDEVDALYEQERERLRDLVVQQKQLEIQKADADQKHDQSLRELSALEAIILEAQTSLEEVLPSDSRSPKSGVSVGDTIRAVIRLIHSLQSQQQPLQDSLDQARERFTRLERDKIKMENEMHQLKEKVAAQEAALMNAEQQSEKNRRDLVRLEGELREKETLIGEQEQQYSAATREISRQEDNIHELNDQVAALKRVITEQALRAEFLDKQLASYVAQSMGLAQDVDNLTKSLRLSTADTRNLEENVQSAEHLLAEHIDAANKMRHQIEKSAAENRQLQLKLAEAQRENEQSHQQAEEAIREYQKTAIEEHRLAEDERRKLEKRLDAARTDLEKAREGERRLRTELDARVMEYRHVVEASRRLGQELKAHKQQVKDLKEALHQAEQQRDALQRKEEGVVSKERALMKKLDYTEGKLSEMNQQNAGLKYMLEKLRKDSAYQTTGDTEYASTIGAQRQSMEPRTPTKGILARLPDPLTPKNQIRDSGHDQNGLGSPGDGLVVSSQNPIAKRLAQVLTNMTEVGAKPEDMLKAVWDMLGDSGQMRMPFPLQTTDSVLRNSGVTSPRSITPSRAQRPSGTPKKNMDTRQPLVSLGNIFG